MSSKEAPRPGLIRAALSGKVTVREAAQALGLSPRQIRRLKARYRKEGARGLLHRSRGRPSPRRLPEKTRQHAARLMQTTYAGLSDCHLTEKLREAEGLDLCRESVRRLRESLKIRPKRHRRPPKHRHRRAPEAREGTLVQTDGSPHDWLQGRGPQMCLMGTVDDATSKFTSLIFRPTEDLHGYATVFMHTFTRYGLPVSFYGDKTSILVRNDPYWTPEEELQGMQNPTHLGLALQELGIGYIPAHSPQAKGRIENRWGTLQDRLVSELRLHHIDCLHGANLYLPEFLEDFNSRFGKAPHDPHGAWRSCPRQRIELALCCRYQRTVARDNTSKIGSRWIQIPPGPGKRSYAGFKVEVRELLDGHMLVLYQKRLIASQPPPRGPFSLAPREHRGSRRLVHPETHENGFQESPRRHDRQPARLRAQGPAGPPTPPAADHPWRKGLPPKRPSTLEGEDIFM